MALASTPTAVDNRTGGATAADHFVRISAPKWPAEPRAIRLTETRRESHAMSDPTPKRETELDPSTQSIPRRIGRYDVKRLLGRGGMGRVFYAVDSELDRPVALKVIHPSLADTPDVMERFRLEARAVARLNHPNIVQIYEFAQEDGLPFFAMEHIDGISLTAWLHKSGPLPVDQAIRLTLAAARALDYARKRDVIHRDVKPENMLITREGRLKLVDFGLAKCLAANSELTQSGTVHREPLLYVTRAEQRRDGRPSHRHLLPRHLALSHAHRRASLRGHLARGHPPQTRQRAPPRTAGAPEPSPRAASSRSSNA